MNVIQNIDVGGTPYTLSYFTTCPTAAATAAKTAALDGFALATGARVTVKFTYPLSVDAPTLNVNGTGAKNIVYYGTARALYPCWEAGEAVEFVYDGTNWCIENGSRYVSSIAAAVNRHICFSSGGDFTLKTANGAKNWDGTLEWSTDAVTWSNWNGATTLSSKNGRLYLRGTGNTYVCAERNTTNAFAGRFVLTGANIACDGNIESLLDYSTTAGGGHPSMAEFCFNGLFAYNEALTAAPVLGGTIMAARCYRYMFVGCTGLTTAPALPATILAELCYNNMFRGCEGLIKASALQAATLAARCCDSMYYNCTSLIVVSALSATLLADRCYQHMYSGCTALKLSTTQTGDYRHEFRIPKSGTGTTATDALANMFANTGGSFTGTPTINTTYYTTAEPIAA